MTTSTPVAQLDPVAVFVTKAISQLTTGVAPKLIDASMEAAYPALAWPIIKQIFEAMVDYLAGKISVLEQEGAITIVFAVEKDSTEYAILGALAKYSDAQASGDPDAISKSLQDAVNQWGSTIHFGGVSPVIGG